MRHSRRGLAKIIRHFHGSSTTSTSLMPLRPPYNKTWLWFSCCLTRVRGTSQWTVTRATGRHSRVLSGKTVKQEFPCTHHMFRKNLTAWLNGDALVRAVASQNNNTIVVINSVGPLILEPWIDHPNVTAVVWAGLGSSETGNALVDVIYGTVNPSGRLPYTIAKSPKDYPAQLVLGGNGEEILNITYSEGCVFAFHYWLLPLPNNSLL